MDLSALGNPYQRDVASSIELPGLAVEAPQLSEHRLALVGVAYAKPFRSYQRRSDTVLEPTLSTAPSLWASVAPRP